jgi:hypothetical protein
MQPIRAKQEWARHQRPHRASDYVVLLSMQIAGIYKMIDATYYKYTCRVCKATCPHLERIVANNMPPNLVCVECTSCGVLGIMMKPLTEA